MQGEWYYVFTQNFIGISIAVSITTTKSWKQPKYPSAINKLWSSIQWNITQRSTGTKWIHVTTWMTLKHCMGNERSQQQKANHCLNHCMWHSGKGKTIGTEIKLVNYLSSNQWFPGAGGRKRDWPARSMREFLREWRCPVSWLWWLYDCIYLLTLNCSL